MNRSMGSFRNAGSNVDPSRGRSRQEEPRRDEYRRGEVRRDPRGGEWGWRAQQLEGSADYGYRGGFIGDHERFDDPYERQRYEAERERHYRGIHEMHGYPPSTYGNVAYDQWPRYGRDPRHDVWRGRDENYDFWGRERHPHEQEGGHPSLWQRVKGVFSGKGPKNYVRSDERIREDVCEHLSMHPYVDASDIEVIVREGEVTLSGTVDARLVKRAAEECCDQVRGVKDVHNHLRVRPRPSAPGP